MAGCQGFTDPGVHGGVTAILAMGPQTLGGPLRVVRGLQEQAKRWNNTRRYKYKSCSSFRLLFRKSADTVNALCVTLTFICTAKFEESERNIPKLSELNRLGVPSSPYSARQYLTMELRLLQFFQWNVALPTAAHFLEYFLVAALTASDCFDGRSLGHQATEARSTLSKYVVYFLEISLQSLSLSLSLSVSLSVCVFGCEM